MGPKTSYKGVSKLFNPGSEKGVAKRSVGKKGCCLKLIGSMGMVSLVIHGWLIFNNSLRISWDPPMEG